MTNFLDGGGRVLRLFGILALLTCPAWSSDRAAAEPDPWSPNRMVVPGNPVRSRLLTCLTGQTRPRMPYTGGPLADKQIAAVAAWIANGAGETEFARSVQPVFRARCLPCHSSASNGGNLALDSYAAMRRTIESYHAGSARVTRWEALYGAAAAPALPRDEAR